MITRTELLYYLILFVYISLWTCQLVACLLTHSLIILTESYINLYRILDVSLGIVHLRTQKALAESRNRATKDGAQWAQKQTMAARLFGSNCTYQFKRLPLLGSFVNELFLAALLVSAAIEGIQTCFHSKHAKSDNQNSTLEEGAQGHDQKSILEVGALTYPLALVGFALVGLVMQHCSMKAHEMREEELHSDSLSDLTILNGPRRLAAANERRPQIEFGRGEPQAAEHPSGPAAVGGPTLIAISELNVDKLGEQFEQDKRQTTRPNSENSAKRRSYDLLPAGAGPGREPASENQRGELPLTIRSCEIAHDEDQALNRISLKSLRFSLNLESVGPVASSSSSSESVSRSCDTKVKTDDHYDQHASHQDNLFLVRSLTSPSALVVCAAIVYFGNNELATEISDAMLALTIVGLLLVASYPPMKRAGKILLQMAPDGVDLTRLERDLAGSSPLILKVRNLHVWSLTPRSNRVATCSLVLDKRKIECKQQVRDIISEARYRFLDQKIKCTTIEPILEDPRGEAAVQVESM